MGWSSRYYIAVATQVSNISLVDYEKHPAVYIIASQRNGTIYIGVTSALWSRIATHKSKSFPGFSSKHGVSMLVWYEHHHTMANAIAREKQLKGWRRSKKLVLIERMNPMWEDLHDKIDLLGTLVEWKEPKG